MSKRNPHDETLERLRCVPFMMPLAVTIKDALDDAIARKHQDDADTCRAALDYVATVRRVLRASRKG